MISVLRTGEVLALGSAGWLIVRCPALRTFSIDRLSSLPCSIGTPPFWEEEEKKPPPDGSSPPKQGLSVQASVSNSALKDGA